MSDTPFISKSDLRQYARDAGLIILGVDRAGRLVRFWAQQDRLERTNCRYEYRHCSYLQSYRADELG